MMPLRVATPNRVIKPIREATDNTPRARKTPATPPTSARGRLTHDDQRVARPRNGKPLLASRAERSPPQGPVTEGVLHDLSSSHADSSRLGEKRRDAYRDRRPVTFWACRESTVFRNRTSSCEDSRSVYQNWYRSSVRRALLPGWRGFGRSAILPQAPCPYSGRTPRRQWNRPL